jgi:hypothetical protein
MVIRTVRLPMRFPWGTFDPFSAGFEIRFGSLNLQAMGPARVRPSVAALAAQLAQVRELEAKLAEDHQQVWLLRATIAGEASGRCERVRQTGRIARDRINTDDNVDNPHTLPRACQKLIATTTLLWSMPEPWTLKARNLHHEAQALIEQVAAQ